MSIFGKTKNDVEVRSNRNLVFAVYDEKGQSYGPLLVHANANVAIRSLQAAMSNTESFLVKFSDDYSLYCLGSYDDRSGKVSTYNEPQFIVRASELISKPVSQNVEVPNAQD